MTAHIHVSKVGTYHPNPKAEVVWTVNDTRGYMDQGPACDECAACECEVCPTCDCTTCTPPDIALFVGDNGYQECSHVPEGEEDDAYFECVGLSFAYVCLDGGDALCEDCAAKEQIEVVPCDCETTK